MNGRNVLIVATCVGLVSSASAADRELVLGQMMLYSGPASAQSSVGKVQTRYFEMINARGGINGRKIKI